VCDVVVVVTFVRDFSIRKKEKKREKIRGERRGNWGETNNELLLSVHLPPS
jgi:hypothetical protein